MATIPTLADVESYLGDDSTWDAGAISDALGAEISDQAARCRIPDLDPVTGDPNGFPPALAEAILRRVAHNLALRALPLGVQATITDAAVATVTVGGTDAEVRRLEAPWRKRVVG